MSLLIYFLYLFVGFLYQLSVLPGAEENFTRADKYKP